MVEIDVWANGDTLAQVIASHAKTNPHAAAYILGEQVLSWHQYDLLSSQLATLLIDSGIERGERVGLVLADSIDTHIAFVACEKAGVIGVGIAARAGEKEITHLLKVSAATALLSMKNHRDLAMAEFFQALRQQGLPLQTHLTIQDSLLTNSEVLLNASPLQLPAVNDRQRDTIEQRRCNPDEVFLLNTTSGTTGRPKCVTQHQRRWFYFAEQVLKASPMDASDVFLSALPASVGFGMWTGHFVPNILGIPTVILSKFSASGVVQAINAHNATVLAAVSTQFIMMLNHLEQDSHSADFSSLKYLYTGGEAVPFNRAAKFEAVTGTKVLQFYGSNETGGLSCTTIHDSAEKRLTTAGRVMDIMELKLLDDNNNDISHTRRGQPACRGPLICQGYYNNDAANEELFTPDGWMKMGDIITIDEDDYICVVGRVDDFIIRGGKNISAVAVEEAVIAHPGVDIAAAVAMPDKTFGEKVCVYLTLVDKQSLSVEELGKFLDSQGVSREYFPERIIQLDELPIVSGGKIAKGKLREDIKQRVKTGQ